MRIRQVVTALVGGLALLGMSGCASWEAKLDQRAKWKKFRDESPKSPTTPFKRWPPEQ